MKRLANERNGLKKRENFLWSWNVGMTPPVCLVRNRLLISCFRREASARRGNELTACTCTDSRDYFPDSEREAEEREFLVEEDNNRRTEGESCWAGHWERFLLAWRMLSSENLRPPQACSRWKVVHQWGGGVTWHTQRRRRLEGGKIKTLLLLEVALPSAVQYPS